jgi:hypothetical protein
MNCWHCGVAIEVNERVGFRECCPRCDRAVHACLNCGFYDPAYHNQCRETMAELVADKQRANFCEYFVPAGTSRPAGRPRAAPGSSPGAARDKLDDLFKKKG